MFPHLEIPTIRTPTPAFKFVKSGTISSRRFRIRIQGNSSASNNLNFIQIKQICNSNQLHSTMATCQITNTWFHINKWDLVQCLIVEGKIITIQIIMAETEKVMEDSLAQGNITTRTTAVASWSTPPNRSTQTKKHIRTNLRSIDLENDPFRN